MQVFLRAADVAVLPHRGSLNSGALMLALTFGLPVVVPRDTALVDEVDDRFAVAYDPAQPGGLADALERARDLATPAASAAALASLAGREPATISRRFATELRARLEA
jgi:glycosyltransferase involved in cell wall biosynthesis